MSAGRFEVLGPLAKGGMAEVSLARVRGEGGFLRPVVVKRILPSHAKDDAFIRMFLDEARHLALVRHPNVVAVYDLGRDEEGPFSLLEYVDGEHLGAVGKRLVSRGEKLELALCAWIVAEVCAGLHAAHEARDEAGTALGLVHRDVAPQNIVVTYDGHVKLLDFGIAWAQRRLQNATVAGDLRGTFEYMSPEQCRSEPLDRRSDIFAVGILLYELVSGVRLFKRGGLSRTIKAITEEPVVPLSRVCDGIPPALDDVLKRALAIDKNARFGTAAEMRAALLKVVHQLGEANPSEGLAARMQVMFEDRMAEKRRMLAQVQEGSIVDRVPLPVAREDAHVELPQIQEMPAELPRTVAMPSAMAMPATVVMPVVVPRTMRAVSPLLGLALGAVLCAVVALYVFRARLRPAPPPEETLVVAESEAPTTTAPVPVAPPVADVELAVTTHPEGATVRLDGKELGATPLVLRVAPSNAESELVVDKTGYQPHVETVLVNRDLRLVVSLHPMPAAARVRRTPSAPPDAGGFRRFD
jgi:hypothetical protein